MTYPQRVADNLLPLSAAGTLPEAFEEWSFTNDVIDHEEPTETCRLCGQEELRYHFLIRNAVNGNTLWVGSQCILRFGISVFDELRRKLSPRDAERRLDRLLQQKRLEVCMQALQRLAVTEPRSNLAGALEYLQRHKKLSPKYANIVLWRLTANAIDHSPTFFQVCLRRDKHKQDLREMKPRQVWTIWPALSPAQRKIAVDMGHAPPPPKLPM